MERVSLTSCRSGGILLPVFSLPGDYGIGDLGPEAHRWIDRLASACLTWWQILPLGPAGAGDSPYQCHSAFAGNPLLISPQLLREDGLLAKSDLRPFAGRRDHIAYPQVRACKTRLLDVAWAAFPAARPRLRCDFEEFVRQERSWLADYALFAALRRRSGGKLWVTWAASLRQRRPAALREAARELREELGREQFLQFLFYRQLRALRQHARRRGIRILGDLPIFVSLDSADVWANQHLFELRRSGRPAAVAGVPPDLFSATGQKWGNPLYRWPAHARQHYAWWAARLESALQQADAVRLDHFRGFAGYWRIPASARTAAHGRWCRGPGQRFFGALAARLGPLPLLAEDLGEITPDVVALRQSLHMPGMLVLQFAFGSGASNPYLPHQHESEMVVYSGTHDNDTSAGWFAKLSARVRRQVADYLPRAGRDPAGAMVEAAWASVARCAIVPLQDVLGLGSSARLNTPGTAECNWCWRHVVRPSDAEAWSRLRSLTAKYNRRGRAAP